MAFHVNQLDMLMEEDSTNDKQSRRLNESHFQISSNSLIHQIQHYLSARNTVHGGEQDKVPASQNLHSYR